VRGNRDAGRLIRSSLELDVALERAMDVSVIVEFESLGVDMRTASVDDGFAS
jgi:hypothetical protein